MQSELVVACVSQFECVCLSMSVCVCVCVCVCVFVGGFECVYDYVSDSFGEAEKVITVDSAVLDQFCQGFERLMK